jgi:hypothetical protein
MGYSLSRRLQSSVGMRKYRLFVDGVVKGAIDPLTPFKIRPLKGRKREKRPLAEDVCCAGRGQSRANWKLLLRADPRTFPAKP